MNLKCLGQLYRKYIKTAKNDGFCEVTFCFNDHGANASEAVQKISTRTQLELCQLTKTANFIATPI